MSFIVNLLFPSSCEVCGKAPEPVCAGCIPQPKPHLVRGFDFEVWAIAELDQSLQKIIRGHKDHQLLALEKHLVQLITATTNLSQTKLVIVVPPRNRNNYRNRGFDPALRLARKSFGTQQEIRVLKANRKVQDQRLLSGSNRKANLVGAFSSDLPPGSQVLLFDDVVTTGSTLREMARAITEKGSVVVGACVLAETISVF